LLSCVFNIELSEIFFIYQLPPGATHTGNIGTPTYTAPEVVARESYGLPSDLWSVGVVLLESLIGELTVDRDKAAAKLIEEKKSSLNKSPFVELICGLLEPDIDKRLTARDALALPIFEKFGFKIPSVRIVDVHSAIPFDDDEKEDEENNGNTTNSNKINNKKSRQQKLSPRERLIKKLCAELDCKNPKTELAAAMYAKTMEEVNDEMDDIANSQTLLDCVVVASRFYEEELISLRELSEDDGECFKSFKDFDIETYQDNEAALMMQMDYSLYLRN
jgi:serine/threonine protein kinase